MAMPGDHSAADAAGHGPVGLSDADREQVITVLKAAFVQGRLTKEELDTRVGLAWTSRAQAELAAVTADLPAGLAGARPLRRPARTRSWPSMNTALTAGAFALIAALVGLTGAIASRSAVAVVAVTLVIAIIGILAFGALIAAAWRERDAEHRRKRPNATG
jgi:Kef-type K+ transport system membrane component KefB